MKKQELIKKTKNKKLLKKLNELLFKKDMLDEDDMILNNRFMCGLIELEELKSEKDKLHDKYVKTIMEIVNIENQMEEEL